jgi:excisionase family DNA binding protein
VTDQTSQRRFLTVEQAAEELNVKSSLIRGLISSGELRAIQVGGRGYLVPNLRRGQSWATRSGAPRLNLPFGFCVVCKDRMGCSQRGHTILTRD